MSRMDLEQNSELRYKGWDVFRSSVRDRMIPLTGSGRALQRVRIQDALPAGDVFEGVAIELSEREARREARSAVSTQIERVSEIRPLGWSKVISTIPQTITGNPDVVNAQTEQWTVGIAPFNGFMTEIHCNVLIAAVGLGFAIRTSSGQTMFSTSEFRVPIPFVPSQEPDFARPLLVAGTLQPVVLRHLRMPILAGDEIYIVFTLTPGFPIGVGLAEMLLVLEAFDGGGIGNQISGSQFRSSFAQASAGAREAARIAGQRAIEREKTARAALIERERSERARIAAEQAREGGAGSRRPSGSFGSGPIPQQKVQSRQPPPPPKPRFESAPAAQASGKGLTFVSAWQPSNGWIGYLIPDPPRGGKVNVFNNRYTIWSLSGQNLGEGPVIPVRTEDEIPPEARISANRGGSVPGGLQPASGPGSFQPSTGEQSLL